jgi:hypothetical protein
MALSQADRQSTAREWIREAFERLGGTATLTTDEIRAAIDAIDDFLDNNQAAINSAFPLPFRTTATLPQKALVVAFVAMKRGNLL